MDEIYVLECFVNFVQVSSVGDVISVYNKIFGNSITYLFYYAEFVLLY